MERRCKCGNFFDLRECSGICPECNKDIFSQSTQGNNVSKKPNNLNMKYRLINLETKEEHLCDKVTINGYDYYALKTDISINDYITDGYKVIKWVDNQSLLGRGKVIATNNPNIDIPKVVDEVKMLADLEEAKEYADVDPLDPCGYAGTDFNLGYKKGYNKAIETHPFSEEDVCDFVEWKGKEKFEWNIRYNNWTSQLVEYSGCVYTTTQLLQLWKEQQPKIVYFK